MERSILQNTCRCYNEPHEKSLCTTCAVLEDCKTYKLINKNREERSKELIERDTSDNYISTVVDKNIWAGVEKVSSFIYDYINKRNDNRFAPLSISNWVIESENIGEAFSVLASAHVSQDNNLLPPMNGSLNKEKWGLVVKVDNKINYSKIIEDENYAYVYFNIRFNSNFLGSFKVNYVWPEDICSIELINESKEKEEDSISINVIKEWKLSNKSTFEKFPLESLSFRKTDASENIQFVDGGYFYPRIINEANTLLIKVKVLKNSSTYRFIECSRIKYMLGLTSYICSNDFRKDIIKCFQSL